MTILDTLEPTYRQLKAMKLDGSPFVIISVIGQELLAQGKYKNAVEVLESALKIGTCSLKLRGSVFSALSSAYWALNSLDKVRNVLPMILYSLKNHILYGGVSFCLLVLYISIFPVNFRQ